MQDMTRPRKELFNHLTSQFFNFVSPIHFPHHNIDTAKNDHDIRDRVAEAHIFQDREVNETRRADAITVGVVRCRR